MVKHLLSKLLCVCAIMLAVSFMANAQTLTLPYFCGFEDATENAQWTFNAGNNGAFATNKWYVSDAEVYAGDNALVISNTQGQTATYANAGCAVVAYRTVTLPAGIYDFSFTYYTGGEVGSDALYACVLSNNANPVSNLTGSLPNGIPSTTTPLTLSEGWQVYNGTINSNGTPQKIVFVWRNNGSTNVNPGGCIDNVQISSQSCGKPTNVQASASGNTITATWSGNASSYDLQYYAYGNSTATTVTGIIGNSHTINGLNEGVYGILVRSNCYSDTSIWVAAPNIGIYDSTAHCINYIDLNGTGTTCTYGSYSNPKADTLVADHGPSQWTSRHTVHSTPGERDPRTCYGLTTTPKGEPAAVRLGNWYNCAEGETVTYTYTVPTNSNNIVIVNYAVIFELPHISRPPEFDIQIADQNGRSIGSCTDLITILCDNDSLTDPSWHLSLAMGSLGSSLSRIWWRDWTKAGFDLSQYAGQTLKITFTTKDGSLGANFGYAYFTISCADATLNQTSRQIADSTEYAAPEGFSYRWINNCTGQEVSTSQTFVIAQADTCSYTCQLISKFDTSCHTSLTVTGGNPRMPESSFAYSVTHSDCQSYINFSNNSQVYEIQDGVKSYLPQASITTQSWLVQTNHKERAYSDLVSDSSTLSQIVVPKEGDTIRVTLTSMYGGLTDDTTITIIVPPIAEYHNTVNSIVCCGTPIQIQDYTITFLSEDIVEVIDGEGNRRVYSDTAYHLVLPLKTQYGCDSITEYHLKPYEADTVRIETTISAGTNIRIAIPYAGDSTQYAIDTTLSAAGRYVLHAQGTVGCDSLCLIVKLIVAGETGIDHTADDAGFNVYLSPNPTAAGNKAQITADDEISVVEVYGIDGRCTQRIERCDKEIDIDGLNVPGMYIVKVIAKSGQVAARKLIVE